MTKRAALLERLADFVVAEGLEAATLRAMADAAGQSDRMLLYYFKDKDQIIAETLAVLADRFGSALEKRRAGRALRKDALHSQLDAIVLDDALWPLLRFRLELSARVAREHPPYAEVGHAMGLVFHGWIESQLATQHADLRRAEATEIMIGLEGVILLKSLGMQDFVAELV